MGCLEAINASATVIFEHLKWMRGGKASLHDAHVEGERPLGVQRK